MDGFAVRVRDDAQPFAPSGDISIGLCMGSRGVLSPGRRPRGRSRAYRGAALLWSRNKVFARTVAAATDH